MKTIAQIIGLACVLALFTGCATNSGVPSAADAAQIKPLNVALKFDDPGPIFKQLFPNGSPIQKDSLETQAEYIGRLEATGLVGKELVLLLPPDMCEVIAIPDQSFYVIVSKDSYYQTYGRGKPFGFSVVNFDEKSYSYPGQNAYGAKADIRAFSGFTGKIAPLDFAKLPSSLRWTKTANDPFVYFGLPVRTTDPQFRTLLKEKKIGLAVRVRLGDLTKLDTDYLGKKATITDPVQLSITYNLLPAHILEMWVVDTTTAISVVHWSPANH